MKTPLAVLLLPFTLLYGTVVGFRNLLFDWGIIKAHKFSVPTISVGNLSVGGTGKTPHVEYLIRLLKDRYRVATLSRGYGRSSKGFVLATDQTDYSSIGDEPLQYFTKFGEEISVAVSEKRVIGINALLAAENSPNVVLLDDAFQHRYVKPGLSILITDFHDLYCQDYLLPAGRLREPRSSAKRADIIIVSKTGSMLSPITKKRLISDLKPLPSQKLFFTHITYDGLVPVSPAAETYCLDKDPTLITLFAGIANPYPLKNELSRRCTNLETLFFKDHHAYTDEDMRNIKRHHDDALSHTKIVVTTEKDVMRMSVEQRNILKDIPLFYMPIKVEFHENGAEEFDKQILDYLHGSSI